MPGRGVIESQSGDAAAAWCPWAAAEADGVLVRAHPVADLLGGALCSWRGQRAIVVLSPRLSSVERRVALAHELVHLERGGGIDLPGMPPGWAAVVAREEAAVDDEVARRLVPRGALRALGPDIGLTEAAELLAVTAELIERALRLDQQSFSAAGSAPPACRSRCC